MLLEKKKKKCPLTGPSLHSLGAIDELLGAHFVRGLGWVGCAVGLRGGAGRGELCNACGRCVRLVEVCVSVVGDGGDAGMGCGDGECCSRPAASPSKWNPVCWSAGQGSALLYPFPLLYC